MRITSVKILCLRVPLSKPRTGNLGVWRHQNGTFIKVETDENVYGIGESWTNFPQWSQCERVATIQECIAPEVIGLDPLCPELIFDRLESSLSKMGVQWGAEGPIWQAISGLDIALWDLKAKAARKSVRKLLSDKTDKVPVYLSGLGLTDVERQIDAHIEAGYKACKLRIGRDMRQTEENLTIIRKKMGDIQIMTDANQCLDLTAIKEYEPLLREYDIQWIEEPLPANDIPLYEQLKDSGFSIPVAVGENIYGLSRFERYVSEGLASVLQPDVTKCGGITQILRLMLRIKGNDRIRLIPHYYGCAPGMAATLQLLGPLNAMLEYDHRQNPMRDLCFAGLSRPSGGMIELPTGMGIGITEVPEEIRRYMVEPFSLQLEKGKEYTWEF